MPPKIDIELLKRFRSSTEPIPKNPLAGAFKREPFDTLQIATWNVASLSTANEVKWGCAFRMYLEAEDPHILTITEVKERDSNVFEQGREWAFLRNRYPYRYWANQAAVISKFRPVSEAIFGFPDGQEFDEQEGKERIITLEFKECYLIGAYVPNSGHNFQHIERRRKWNTDFSSFLLSLDLKKPVIWSGDFNVVRPYTTPKPYNRATSDHTSPDLQWHINWRKLAGTHADEIKAHEELLDGKGPASKRRFRDVWRLINGEDTRKYTHTSKQYGGWRIDGFIVSERFLHRIRACEIRYAWKNVYWPDKDSEGIGAASDHWPVWLSLEMERGEFEDEQVEEVEREQKRRRIA
ncbi:hypothetical protein JCM5353_004659 [Sporobolomyces roseus]